MILKRVGILSVAKIAGCVYLLLGLIIGGLFSLFALLGVFAGHNEQMGGMMFAGVLAVIFFPLIYGTLGFLGGLLMAALYNLFASMLGGIELELVPNSKPENTNLGATYMSSNT